MSAELAREFLDTNVLVYAYDRSAGEKHRRALHLLEQLATRKDGALSIQVLQEFFVTVTTRLPKPLPVRDAAAIVSDLGALLTHAPGVTDVLAAIDMHDRLQVSFWDAMILRSASVLRCALVWSEDLAHGRRYDDVEVRNPFT
ncbi:MAG TPA: PIN domain-containing protein [Candidatus Dormibacteraeota bacterium]|nr:PIN domain-containing protein [Candidatus Dormibacteraeota bacterium]